MGGARVLLDGLDSGVVERRVDPHGPGKPKAYHIRVNGEGTYKPGGQPATLQLKGEVAGGEPDLLASWLVGGKRSHSGCIQGRH